MEMYQEVANAIMEFYATHEQVISLLSTLGMVALCLFLLVGWYNSNSEHKLTKATLVEEQKLTISVSDTARKMEMSNASFIAQNLGKFEEGQVWRGKVLQYIKLAKMEASQLEDRNSTQSILLVERENEIKRITGLAEQHYEELQDISGELEKLKNERDDLLATVNNYESQERPDYDGIIQARDERIAHLEKMNSKLTSARDDVTNQRDRMTENYKEQYLAREKTAKTYKAKLDKLRSAIRGEGWGYELNGRKIVLFETEE